ncbi:MAG: acyl-CoA reductase [Candidatus Margulisiibacteriota bacterium]
MHNSLTNVTFLKKASTSEFSDFINQPPLVPFDDETIDYLNALSKVIRKDPILRNYPDVATFAFFCRESNINQLKKRYSNTNSFKLGRGVIFHISPSNVPINFAFSLVSGLLSGNVNIVRVPSKVFEQVNIVVNAINELSKNKKYHMISNRILLVQYDRNSDATRFFSSHCDVRIIWGGDETIQHIRNHPIPSKSFDITFADRYSISAINTNELISSKAKIDPLVNGFYNDTFLFDQNACTAPHLIVWLGSKKNIENTKTIFWNRLNEIVQKEYVLNPISAVKKLTTFFSQCIEIKNTRIVKGKNNLIWRAEINKLDKRIDEFRCNSGYFSEYTASSLNELSLIINRKYQTLSYYGLSKENIHEFLKRVTPVGIDRIVPIGRTLEFSLTWDSYNLIESLSRNIEIL